MYRYFESIRRALTPKAAESKLPEPSRLTRSTPPRTVFPPTETTPPRLDASAESSGHFVVNNVHGDQHIVYEAGTAPPAPHALDLLKMLDPTPMDATSRPQCLDGTRTAILQSLISNLTRPQPDTNVFWFHGMAGSGKSTISTTIAEQLHDRGQRGAFIFFDRHSPAQNGPDGIIRTLACQLALSNGIIGDAVCDEIVKDPQIATRTLDSQFKALVMASLRSCSAKMTGPVVIIIDAFDECGDAQSRRAIVHLLINNLPLLPHIFRFLITGRPVLDLDNAFGSHPAIKSVPLSAAEWSSAADVLRYIQHELDELYQMRRRSDELPPGWPGKQRLEQFGLRAADSFIWAATGIRYLRAADDLDERLDRLLSQQAFSLGDLYATALRSVSNWDPNEASTETCRRVLGAVVVGRIPLTSDTMDSILGLENSKSSRRILRKLGCLLQWSEGLPVRTLHASFADYLTDARMCGDHPWFIDESKDHLQFSIGCLRIMKRLLRFNICGLNTSYLMNRDVQDLPDRIQTCIPQSLAYACRFWGEHLRHANTPDREVQVLILEFFQVSFLYWLEVLSLIGESRAALAAMVSVRSLCKDCDDKVQDFAKDGIKFVSAFASIIADSAPHVYISAFSFAPFPSIINKQYSVVIKNTLLATKCTRTDWPPCEGIIEEHNGPVNSVAFSLDGERVVSGSDDKTICIWDARTGKLVAMSEQSDRVSSVAFSPDGERIASGSIDKTIYIWDACTGELVTGPFNGHTDRVNSVVFSPDGENVASGSDAIRIWDARTGELVTGPFEGHTGWVLSLAFSPDGERVASSSSDSSICVWDARTGELIAGSFEGHSGSVNSVAFSPDGEHIVSGSEDKTIRIWDARTARLVVGTFEGHARPVKSVSYSPDGECIVSGSRDGTIIIWDARTGKLIAGPFKGHLSDVNSAVFSPDGERIVSGSEDGTIRLWDARIGEFMTESFKEHGVTSVVFLPDGQRIVSAWEDSTIRFWDVRTGELVAGPFKKSSGQVTSVAFSADGERVIYGSYDGTIRIWYAHTDELIAELFNGHTYVSSVAFSPDGNHVASGSWDSTIRIWYAHTGKLVAGPMNGHTGWVSSVAFSPDSNRVASGSQDGTIRIWDATTGKLIAGSFEGHSEVTSVTFSPDGEHIVSGSGDSTIRIWDAHTAKLVAGPIEGHVWAVTSVACSPDGKRFVSGSDDGTIRIWDAQTGELVANPSKKHSSPVTSVAFSPDGECIVSSSDGGVIRIFHVPCNANPPDKGYNTCRQLENGWMRNSSTELLFWVPPTYRTALWMPDDIVIIGEYSTRVDLTRFVHGENWAQCHV